MQVKSFIRLGKKDLCKMFYGDCFVQYSEATCEDEFYMVVGDVNDPEYSTSRIVINLETGEMSHLPEDERLMQVAIVAKNIGL